MPASALAQTLQRHAQHIHVKMVNTGASSESFVLASTAEPPLAKTQVLTIWCVTLDGTNARGRVLRCQLAGWPLIS